MNYNSENKSQKNSAVDLLIQKNAEAITELELQPYQPVVYAIPVTQRTTELNLAKQIVTFQPTLYRMIDKLATKKELEDRFQEIQEIEMSYMENTVAKLTAENQKAVRTLIGENSITVQEMQASAEQAGKNQEEFILKLSSAMDKEIRNLNTVIDRLNRRFVQILIGTSAAAALLSVIVSVVFWKLAG